MDPARRANLAAVFFLLAEMQLQLLLSCAMFVVAYIESELGWGGARTAL
ncbi:hypothetical protein Tsubulata_045273, partial [Turnera subulata]